MRPLQEHLPQIHPGRMSRRGHHPPALLLQVQVQLPQVVQLQMEHQQEGVETGLAGRSQVPWAGGGLVRPEDRAALDQVGDEHFNG